MRRALLVAVLIATLPRMGNAANPALRCQHAKLKASLELARDDLNCQITAANSGGNVDATCVNNATNVFDSAFAEAEALGLCATAGDAASVVGEIDAFVARVVGAIRPVPIVSECAATKLRGARAYSLAVLKAEASDRAKPDGGVRLYRARQKAQAALVKAFARADGRGSCLTTDDSPVARGEGDFIAGRVVGKLYPRCGDGVRVPTEECDGSDALACPGHCRQDCTCAVCGNNVAETGEQCDGTSDEACRTLCQADCSCPPPVCGNRIVEAGEACDPPTPLSSSNFSACIDCSMVLACCYPHSLIPLTMSCPGGLDPMFCCDPDYASLCDGP